MADVKSAIRKYFEIQKLHRKFLDIQRTAKDDPNPTLQKIERDAQKNLHKLAEALKKQLEHIQSKNVMPAMLEEYLDKVEPKVKETSPRSKIKTSHKTIVKEDPHRGVVFTTMVKMVLTFGSKDPVCLLYQLDIRGETSVAFTIHYCKTDDPMNPKEYDKYYTALKDPDYEKLKLECEQAGHIGKGKAGPGSDLYKALQDYSPKVDGDSYVLNVSADKELRDSHKSEIHVSDSKKRNYESIINSLVDACKKIGASCSMSLRFGHIDWSHGGSYYVPYWSVKDNRTDFGESHEDAVPKDWTLELNITIKMARAKKVKEEDLKGMLAALHSVKNLV